MTSRQLTELLKTLEKFSVTSYKSEGVEITIGPKPIVHKDTKEIKETKKTKEQQDEELLYYSAGR